MEYADQVKKLEEEEQEIWMEIRELDAQYVKLEKATKNKAVLSSARKKVTKAQFAHNKHVDRIMKLHTKMLEGVL